MKFSFTFIILAYGLHLFAQNPQESLTLNFARPVGSVGVSSSIKISVDNEQIGAIANGTVFSYKHDFKSNGGSVLILISSSIYNKTLSFAPTNGADYYFEVGFGENGLYLISVEKEAYQKDITSLNENEQTGVYKNNKKDITYTKTTDDSKTQYKYNKNDKSLKVDYEKDLNSEQIRQQWMEKGGKLKNTSFLGGASVLYKDLGNDLLLSGIGANAAFSQNFFDLKVPEYSTSRSSWRSFQFGYGFSGNYNTTIVNSKTGSNLIDPITSSYSSITVNGNVGLILGTGFFNDETNWNGYIVELNYKPSLVIGIPKDGDSTTEFNYTGFSIDYSKSNFTSTLNKIAPKAQLKMSVFVLPPVGDMPFFISMSLGAVWYSK